MSVIFILSEYHQIIRSFLLFTTTLEKSLFYAEPLRQPTISKDAIFLQRLGFPFDFVLISFKNVSLVHISPFHFIFFFCQWLPRAVIVFYPIFDQY